MNISKTIQGLNNLAKLGDNVGIDTMLINLPDSLEDIAELVLTEDYDTSCGYEKDIKNLLEFLQHVYNNTIMSEPVSNETYDKLYELYKEISGSEMVGSNIIPSGKKTGYHKYPHLRGSLDKVHYLRRSDVPKGDNRKSLEEWFDRCMDTCNILSVNVASRKKYDGVSVIFEYNKDKILERALTRGDTEQNLAQDVTEAFNEYTFEELFGDILCDEEFVDDFAIKTECLMTEDNFKRYNEDKGVSLKNTRSAVISFINSDEHERNDLTYITLEALEVSSRSKIVRLDESDTLLVYVGENEYGFHNYLIFSTDINYDIFELRRDSFYVGDKTVSRMERLISILEKSVTDAYAATPIDGVVFSIINKDAVAKIGRKDNINKFQIAYKFPAGIKKTTVKDVKFQVGLMGGITPVIEFEPIVIMGNTLTNASTGSINKLESLDINIGDEIIIKYDIIPIVMKDETCKKGEGNHIESPTTCPICGEELGNEGLNVFCDNDDCDSRIIGKIVNYTNKLDIKHISIAIITDLVENGFLNTIADLYRLPDKLGAIVQIKGYKEPMMRKIFGSLYAKTEMYAHDFLGSLGIPSIGRRVMEKVCKEVPFTELINNYNDINYVYKLSKIKGIGEATSIKIINGIHKNISLIEDLMRYITIKPYTESSYNETVVFTKVRDKDFEKYLEDNGVKVASSYSKSTDVVITKNVNEASSKLDKARKDGKLILSLEEAKKKYGYDE